MFDPIHNDVKFDAECRNGMWLQGMDESLVQIQTQIQMWPTVLLQI